MTEKPKSGAIMSGPNALVGVEKRQPDITRVLRTTQCFIKMLVEMHDLGATGVGIEKIGARKSIREGAVVVNLYLEKSNEASKPDTGDSDGPPSAVGDGGEASSHGEDTDSI